MCFLPCALRLLLSAFCLLPSAFCFLLSACTLLPSLKPLLIDSSRTSRTRHRNQIVVRFASVRSDRETFACNDPFHRLVDGYANYFSVLIPYSVCQAVFPQLAQYPDLPGRIAGASHVLDVRSEEH